MIKIEVTGNSIGEVADKLLAIGGSLRNTVVYDADNAAREALQAKRDAAKIDPIMPEVAEMAAENPTPTPKSASAAEAIESQPTTEEPSSTPAPAPSASEPLDFDKDVAPAVLALVAAKGKPAVQDILSEYGVERASQVDEDLWPELVATLRAAV